MRARPSSRVTCEDSSSQLRLVRGGRDDEGIFNDHLFDLEDLLLRFSADNLGTWKGYRPFQIPHQVKGYFKGDEAGNIRDKMSVLRWTSYQVADLDGIVGVTRRVLPALYLNENWVITCVLCTLGNRIGVVDDIGLVRNASSVFVHRSWLPRP
jgi:hypothetical protein